MSQYLVTRFYGFFLASFSLKIPARWHGLTLSSILLQCQPLSPAECWQQRLADGMVQVDGVLCDREQRLTQGQRLTYWVSDYIEPNVSNDWQMLWENDDFLAVDKPAGLPVSRTTRHPTQHLIGLVQQHGFVDAHLMHRLDAETAGVILLAKSKSVAQRWQPRLPSLMVAKRYHAMVWGEPDWEHFRLECQLKTRSDSVIRCQMHICRPDEVGQNSITRFQVLERYGDTSLIACDLETGRKHQIRAHLAHLGYPIVGDKIYSSSGKFYLKRLSDDLTELDVQILGATHHLLHAYQLRLKLDQQQDPITITSQLSINKVVKKRISTN
ncbi:RluA family pseudouridine synthase [Celerinatantimonas yamalensis]|uniref:Pseudouridine synthase n=1 Tax=Celerinatantimonas yamalensis TaxID=559956 RepID=A0ABW9G1Q0_9GAMM